MLDKSSLVIPTRWTEQERAKRLAFKCSAHHHNGINHQTCYNNETGLKERKAVLDIECGGLDAGFDIMYCWCLKPIGEDNILYDHLTAEDFTKGNLDRRILESFCETVWGFDRLIAHYGSNHRFDIPFMRTRAIRQGIEDFPKIGEMFWTDTYPMSKKLLRLRSYRQGSVARALLGRDEKTVLDSDKWRAVKYGTVKNKMEAMKGIVDHCQHDVQQCEEIYTKMLPYYRELRSTI